MIGCLCIHGFTGAPFEVAPLVQFLQERTNWHFAVPTLPGHGDNLNLKGVHYKEWIEHADLALRDLMEKCDTIYVIGFSMGGLIASYLAANYPIDKLVLLSAAAYYVNPKQLVLDIKEIIKDSFKGKITDNELFLRYKRKITQTPLSATIQFRTLVTKVRPLLSGINSPTFIAQGQCDGIVPPKSAEYLYSNIGAEQKRLIFYQNAKHLICHSEEREKLFREVFLFLQK
ncbi:alpha/beta hydrolase [Bacillus marasmi]|uniref:alpha/beta hydrolase n=1 Tax=Bacillus marasmi TaxID=1926279 RepID=UPI00164CDF86|nr:alpha/beta fold hydrolase [Bacillus marasmi]